MSKKFKKGETSLELDKNYKFFLNGVKDRFSAFQICAELSINKVKQVNKKQIKLYWKLGTDIVKYQKKYQCDEKFLKQLSYDLRKNFPGIQEFSISNLRIIKQFSQIYPDLANATKLVSQLSWGHITRLIRLVEDPVKREWYALTAIRYYWSRSMLEARIKNNLYDRQLISLTVNYEAVGYREARVISKGMFTQLAKLGDVRVYQKPMRYFKIPEQFQVLYEFDITTLKCTFKDLQNNLSSDWYILNADDAIWNKSTKKKQVPLLDPSVVWAHLDVHWNYYE
jgi:predicted nuclease of restriction endonuclease-like (RecB) superfamily